MNMKPFSVIASAVFALVATAHLLRLVLRWDVVIAGVSVPLWVSVAGVVLPGGLALVLWRESRLR